MSYSPARHHEVFDEIIHAEPTPSKVGERVVTKLVQVPVTREVKVPAVVEKVVPHIEIKEFPVKKVRQEQAYKTVEEEYVDYEEREATRMKEIWVRQEVPEKYVERVPVKKVRHVEVPYTTTKEYTEIQRVEIPTSKVVEESGYRVDKIVEYETREVEGRQKVEWIPRVVDEWAEERDLGVRERRVVERQVGHIVYSDNGEVLRGNTSPAHGRSPAAHVGSPTRRELYAGSVTSDVGLTPSRGFHSTSWDVRGESPYGLYIKESVIGLVVKSVAPGSAAAEAGISAGDVIHSVDGLEVYSLEDWRRAISRKHAVAVTYRSKRQGRNVKANLSQY